MGRPQGHIGYVDRLTAQPRQAPRSSARPVGALLFVLSAMVATGVVLYAPPAAAGTPGRPPTVPGAWLTAELAAGRPFAGHETLISGDIDLRSTGTVTAPFKCVSCTIDGALIGAGTTFRSLVDLTGTQVRHLVDLEGASLTRGMTWAGGTAEGDVRLDLAVFGETAFFDSWTVAGRASLIGTHFESNADFSSADFLGDADFTGATFSSAALFSGQVSTDLARQRAALCHQPHVGLDATQGVFSGTVAFSNVTFVEQAIFRGRCFVGDMMMLGATGDSQVDFTDAQFVAAAHFAGSTFADDVSFTYTRFADAANLEKMRIGKDLSFEAAQFHKGLSLVKTTVVGGLSFEGLQLSGPLQLSGVKCASLTLDIRDVDLVSGPDTQIETLQRIEQTARGRSNAALANDARYEWLRRSGKRHSPEQPWWYPFFDNFLYREVAGYLARPWHPVRAFLVLLLVGTLVRAAVPPAVAMALRLRGAARHWWGRRRRPAAAPVAAGGSSRSGRARLFSMLGPATSWPALKRGLDRLGQGCAATLSVAVRRRPAIPAPDPPTIGQTVLAGIRMGEYLAFKALLVVAVLCVANANETLHQLIAALISS